MTPAPCSRSSSTQRSTLRDARKAGRVALHDADVLTINGPSYRLKGRLDPLRTAADSPD